jgi:hypothetical protein
VALDFYMAAADKPILARPAVRAMFAEDLRETFRHGPRAFTEDLAILARPWRFRWTRCARRWRSGTALTTG